MLSILYVALNFFESPKYYHTVKKYKESRESMKKLALYNGVADFSTDFIFAEEAPNNGGSAAFAFVDSGENRGSSTKLAEISL